MNRIWRTDEERWDNLRTRLPKSGCVLWWNFVLVVEADTFCFLRRTVNVTNAWIFLTISPFVLHMDPSNMLHTRVYWIHRIPGYTFSLARSSRLPCQMRPLRSMPNKSRNVQSSSICSCFLGEVVRLLFFFCFLDHSRSSENNVLWCADVFCLHLALPNKRLWVNSCCSSIMLASNLDAISEL